MTQGATTQALLLNQDYTPLRVISWQRAFALIQKGKARLVESYARFIRTTEDIFEWPAVVQLTYYVKARYKVRLNRGNLLARDGYQCAYCGVRPLTKAGLPDLSELTLDHVIPRAKGGRNTWDNLVSACSSCNGRKGARTPGEAKMPLRFCEPHVPTPSEVLWIMASKIKLPTEWRAHAPKAWQGYWTDELQD